MSFRGWLSWLKPRPSSARRPRFRRVSPLSEGGLLDWVLEDRCLPAGFDPLVPANSGANLTEIFWNGGDTPPKNLGPLPNQPPSSFITGIPGIPTLKTITITNTTAQSIFPILRAANTGQDPANTNPKNTQGWYDPQDFHNEEYRAYIGYVQNGTQYLGLPAGATITMRVPVVFWDAENTYIGTDGQHLIPADPAKDSNPFRYDVSSLRGVSTSTDWVTKFNDPSGATSGGLVMFYHAKQPQTPSLDSPAQLTEFTIRDPYLNTGGGNPGQGWLTDPAQTSVLFNYDVSYVDNLTSPIAMAAADVPIPIPDVQNPPNADFGWAGSDLIYGTPTTAASMQKLISDFINNTGSASIGQYFGPPGTNGTSPGWPSYFNPGTPLQLTGVTVTNQGSGYASQATIEFSGGGGSGAKGTVITSNGQVIGVTITDPGKDYTSAPSVMIKDGGGTSAVGQAIINGVTKQVTEVAILSGGSGYLSVDFSDGGGSGATATPVVTAGRITGVVIANPGDGYTSAPTVTINHGGGSGATATAVMLPGDLKIPGGANIFANSPFNNQRSSYVTDPNNPNSLWMLSSGGSGAISQGVGAADMFVAPPQHGVELKIHLSLNQSTRPTIVHTLQQMLANGQKVEFSVSPNPTVLGTVKAYDPADKLTGIMLLPGGEGHDYDPNNPPTVNIIGGGGSGAKAHANIVGGKIVSVSLDDPGSGYTSAPTVTFTGGPGSDANYIATIGGGFATMVFDKDPPLNQGISYVFSRPVTDYASLAIQNLWYSWAEFYVNQFKNFVPPTGVTGSIDKGTNTLALNSAPTGNSALAVGMTVSGSGIVPATGTSATILEMSTNGIKSIAVNDPNGGYNPLAPPIVNITGGGGSGATASAVVSAAGFITSVIVTNAGSGYTSVPNVSFTGGGSATGTATVAPLVLSLSQLSPEGGSGTYTFAAPKAMPFADKTGVKSILVTNPGGGYATPPTIKFTGGGGLGAAGTVITSNGQVVGVTITGGGAQYTSAPTVAIEGGGGTGATGTAIIDSGGFVTGVTITNGGTGYLSVDITGGGGSGATATAVVSLDGHITGVAITHSGTGYTSAPTVTFHGGGGSGAVATATVGTFVTTFPLTFTKDQQATALQFAGSVYAAMAAEADIAGYTTKSPLLPPSMSLVYTVIGADIADLPNAIGKDSLVGAQVRDLIKSILRGVPDFKVVPESQWYPNPATWQGGQKFNVYNLDPYVWFVHRVLGLSGYGFSVDDDTADVSAAASNYTLPPQLRVLPNNLQYVFSGLGSLTNTKQWFNSVPYGFVTDKGSIVNPTSGPNQGKTILKLTTTNKYWQLVNPDLKAGQIGAYVSDSGGNILPGTTIVGQGDVKQLILILSNRAPSANNVTLTFTGDPPANPVLNTGFEKPQLTQKPPNNYTPNPSGAQWTFSKNSGIAGNGSSLTALNGPAPQGMQVAYLQGDGTISQKVTLQAGTYTLNFYAAQRKRGNTADRQTIKVMVDGNERGRKTPSGTNYTAYSVTFTIREAGQHTIQLSGTGSGDMALIDVVTLSVVSQANQATFTTRKR